MTYRHVTPQDADAIAALHALSWQLNYRGIWSDAYLDDDLEEERKIYWNKKMNDPKENTFCFLAEEDGILCGFVYAISHHHQEWGTLIDNVHVRQTYQGRGIGLQLMKAVAQWIHEEDLPSKCYLFVLAKNKAGIRFYERHGGVDVETRTEESPGGGTSDLKIMVWEDSNMLL